MKTFWNAAVTEARILIVQVIGILWAATILWIVSTTTPWVLPWKSWVSIVAGLRFLRNYLLWEHHPTHKKPTTP